MPTRNFLSWLKVCKSTYGHASPRLLDPFFTFSTSFRFFSGLAFQCLSSFSSNNAKKKHANYVCLQTIVVTHYECSTSLPKQRLAQFKPIRELYLYQGMRRRTPNTIAKTKESATKFMKFCVKFVLFTLQFSLASADAFGFHIVNFPLCQAIFHQHQPTVSMHLSPFAMPVVAQIIVTFYHATGP